MPAQALDRISESFSSAQIEVFKCLPSSSHWSKRNSLLVTTISVANCVMHGRLLSIRSKMVQFLAMWKLPLGDERGKWVPRKPKKEVSFLVLDASECYDMGRRHCSRWWRLYCGEDFKGERCEARKEKGVDQMGTVWTRAWLLGSWITAVSSIVWVLHG